MKTWIIPRIARGAVVFFKTSAFCIGLSLADYGAASGKESLSAKTGFLVIAPDRGFLGNQETREVMAQFKKDYPASLALLGRDSQGLSGQYDEYLRKAVAELEEKGMNEIVAIPLFFSRADAVLNRFTGKLPSFVKRARLTWTPPLAESYLAAELLRDRIAALSNDPSRERLIVIGSGARDEAGEKRIREELDALTKEAAAGQPFREIATLVYYERDAEAALQKKNEEFDNRVIRTAAKPGKTLVIPFAIGPKFDGHMSLEGWMQRKFGEFDIALGASIIPHPEVLTWLKRSANAHVPAVQDKIAVIVMPHGSVQPYNDGLEKVIAPLRKRYHVEMAYGMADPLVLNEAVQTLEREGYKRAVFVRMYALDGHMKAESDYILGISSHPPGNGHDHGASPGGAGLPPGARPPRVRTSMLFKTFGGYEEDPATADILRERILAISGQAERETVILLAHGSGGEQENARWLAVMNANIALIQKKLDRPFKAIKAMALREDWPELREKSLAEIKEEIRKGNENGGAVLLISNRLYGSGPYKEMLSGSEFRMNGQGLAPHPALTRWLEQGIENAIRDMTQTHRIAVSNDSKEKHHE
ncbi:MAG: hypothetical protein IDH49_03105 [Gammaproteobacteria bacterium]|nr:hypothetical protein [Gammaproteobacteria bacterium]